MRIKATRNASTYIPKGLQSLGLALRADREGMTATLPRRRSKSGSYAADVESWEHPEKLIQPAVLGYVLLLGIYPE